MKQSIAGYAIKLAKLKPRDVRFVVMDGSTAEGSDRSHSDYDIVVVRKGLSKKAGSVKDLFGMFNGRLVSGWLVDAESFKHRYLGDDDSEFLWRAKGLRKAKLLYGKEKDFSRIIRKAQARRWNRERQMAVIRYSYVTMVEYMGKMLNKIETHEDGTPEFFQDGYIIATNAAQLVAAVNRIDLDSDKTMYRQVLAQAKTKPPHFGRDFGISSGLVDARRRNEEVLSASRRLIAWSRKQILDSFKPSKDDGAGFWGIVREMDF